ncbi:MAG: glycosyltransferase family 2 protein [Nitrospirae bacterium]|nr:glycosyltransferase family 2 protein [Nitrospirota bacterium]
MTGMDFSIVIVNYNTRELLKDCLRSIYRSGEDEIYEVVVVDNNSSDGSAEMVRDEFPRTRLIINESNLGFAGGCNKGITLSRGRYIILLNSDTEMLPRSLERLKVFLDSERAGPETGIIGCRILNPDGSLQFSVGKFPSLWSTVTDMLRPCHKRKYCLAGYDTAHEADWVTGAFIAIDRRVVEDVGGFDERFFMYYEEVDWCLRAKKRGWKVFYFPHVSIIHKTPHAAKKHNISLKVAQEVRRSHLYYFRKNHRTLSFISLSAATLVLLSIDVLKWYTAFYIDKKVRQDRLARCRSLLANVWRTFLELSRCRMGPVKTGNIPK